MRSGDAGWRNRFSTAGEPNLADTVLMRLLRKRLRSFVNPAKQPVSHDVSPFDQTLRALLRRVRVAPFYDEPGIADLQGAQSPHGGL